MALTSAPFIANPRSRSQAIDALAAGGGDAYMRRGKRTRLSMNGFLIRAAVVAIGLWLASEIVPGVHILSPGSLIAAALLLGVINASVRPILILLTLPITLLTLGLFLLVINGLMIELVSYFLKGFVVDGLWPAILTSIIVSLTSWVMSGWVGPPHGRIEVVSTRHMGRWD
jgi:putative membrane protein